MAFTTTSVQNIYSSTVMNTASAGTNTCEMTDGERFGAWFDNVGDKRLTYKTLTHKSQN